MAITEEGNIVSIDRLGKDLVYSLDTSNLGIEKLSMSKDENTVVGIDARGRVYLWEKIRTERWWGNLFRFEVLLAITLFVMIMGTYLVKAKA